MNYLPKILKNKRNLFLLGVILIGIFIGWSKIAKSSQPLTQYTTVQKGTLKQELTLSGSIDASEHVSMNFQTSGLLSSVNVAEGDTVKKGQSLASLDQRALKKSLQKYLNTYTKTRQDFDQTKDDYKDTNKTDSIKRALEKSQLDLNNTIADVELQDLSLKLSTLTTPIDGIVTKVTTPFAGVNVTPLNSTIEVINPSTMYMKVTADQTEVVNLHIGQLAQITLDAFPDTNYTGTIKSISYTPSTTDAGTSYEIKLEVPMITTRDSFRIGMTGDVTFVTQEKQQTIYLPLEYVKSDEKGKYVLTDSKGTKKYIKTGLETDENIEVTTGLQAGDTVYDRT